jgi:RNA polymerase sigma-70 factor (ECF subfamily)
MLLRKNPVTLIVQFQRYFLNHFSTYTDEALVKLLPGSEAVKAFEELYNRYWEKLIVHATVKLKNEANAEEVVQQVFINLWRRRDKVAIKYTFHTFIASAVKFEIFNFLAKQQRLKSLHVAAADSLNEVDSTAGDSIFDHRMALLQEELSRLPEKTRIIFSLSRQEEMSGKEIAEKLNISTKTVEAHITKALKQLRSALGHFLLSLL